MRRHIALRCILVILWLFFAAALMAFFGNLFYGPETIVVFAISPGSLDLSLALRLDSLSTLLLVMVTLLGAIIGRYSVRHLDGEARQWYFFRYLLFTVAGVSLFVVSSNLPMLFVMWLCTSFGLHKLLLFFPDRPGAIYAARKKLIVSRIGDLALLSGMILIFRALGTLEFTEISEALRGPLPNAASGDLLSLAGLLVVAGAMAKSVQFPFHFWLPETMETPSPVSALMHAGIINAGGFLIIRLSPLVDVATFAQLTLTVVGAATAALGALTMITQNDIKKKLAYSTISQMGLMMFACGLGAYTMALFHIFAHSFYKAHAFLSTGTLVRESARVGFKLAPPRGTVIVLATLAGLCVVLAGFFYESGVYLAVFSYSAVLLLGLFQNTSTRGGERPPLRRATVLMVLGLVVALAAYVGVESLMDLFLSGLVHPAMSATDWNSPRGIAALVAYGFFASAFWVSALLMKPAGGPLLSRLYTFFWSGGYMSALTTRVLASISPVIRLQDSQKRSY
ncbi:MAG: hypothetical protein H7A21_20685 [Spirochaetales bacterium]|nr:hypothetical protein [Spirochaetales bacterium]